MAKITVQKLADMLGLSGAAVSMALHGKPGVSEDTRRRVLETARQQGYVPPRRTARGCSRGPVLPPLCPSFGPRRPCEKNVKERLCSDQVLIFH